MGHQRVNLLPRTRRWQQVVELIRAGADAPQVAQATILAAEKAFQLAATDRGLVEVVSLIAQLPLAARSGDFARYLRLCGIQVADPPDLLDVVAGLSEAIDAKFPNNRGRTDIGEMAQLAAAEAVAEVVGAATRSIFGADPDDVRAAFAALHTPSRFGSFARCFFAKLTARSLNAYLSRTLSDFVGGDRRFTSIRQEREFAAAVELHAREAAEIVEEFAGDWFSKANFTHGGVPRSGVAGFTERAIGKLVEELRRGARTRGE